MKSKDIIFESVRFIEQNLERELTISEIAKTAGYSEYHFARMFKEEMKLSVMGYVRRRKLIRASEDILKGDRVTDAAFKYGWQSHSGFTRAFKNEFGFYPALLRAMLIEIESLGGNAMSHVFMRRTDEHATKEQLLEILKEEMQAAGIDFDEAEMENIYQYACSVYGGLKRYSGDEYVTHPLNVAIILAQMNAGRDTVYAGIFCDVLSKTGTSAEELRNKLSRRVFDIVVKLHDYNTVTDCIFENEEVVMIKLAERLHNMRTLDVKDKTWQAVKAGETIDLYMPVARRLGNEKLIEELNDLSLKYL